MPFPDRGGSRRARLWAREPLGTKFGARRNHTPLSLIFRALCTWRRRFWPMYSINRRSVACLACGRISSAIVSGERCALNSLCGKVMPYYDSCCLFEAASSPGVESNTPAIDMLIRFGSYRALCPTLTVVLLLNTHPNCFWCSIHLPRAYFSHFSSAHIGVVAAQFSS